MKKILVTGSDGFIGSHLVRELERTGSEIICVDKAPKQKDTLRMNVASKRFVKYFKKKDFDYIYHFGSPCSVLLFNKNPEKCLDNTLSGFRNIISIIKDKDTKLIYPSSGNVYGSKSTPHSELDQTKPCNLYGIGKAWCEYVVQVSKVNAIGLRIFCAYGDGEEMKGYLSSVLCQFLKDVMNRRSPLIWGDGSQTRDFIYIDDLIEGILGSAMLEGFPFMNLGSGVSTDYNDLVKIINKVLGSDIAPQYIERPKNYVLKTFADTHLMRLTLGLIPRSLEDGISRFVEYMDLKY